MLYEVENSKQLKLLEECAESLFKDPDLVYHTMRIYQNKYVMIEGTNLCTSIYLPFDSIRSCIVTNLDESTNTVEFIGESNNYPIYIKYIVPKTASFHCMNYKSSETNIDIESKLNEDK